MLLAFAALILIIAYLIARFVAAVITYRESQRIREDREYEVADDLYLASVLNGSRPMSASDDASFHDGENDRGAQHGRS